MYIIRRELFRIRNCQLYFVDDGIDVDRNFRPCLISPLKLYSPVLLFLFLSHSLCFILLLFHFAFLLCSALLRRHLWMNQFGRVMYDVVPSGRGLKDHFMKIGIFLEILIFCNKFQKYQTSKVHCQFREGFFWKGLFFGKIWLKWTITPPLIWRGLVIIIFSKFWRG